MSCSSFIYFIILFARCSMPTCTRIDIKEQCDSITVYQNLRLQLLRLQRSKFRI